MVSASSDLEATLEAVADAAHRLTGSENTVLAVFEDDSRLVVRAALGAVGLVSASRSTSPTG